MADWTDDELRAAVNTYLEMLALQEANEPYSKADFARQLLAGPLRARAGGAREGKGTLDYHMGNISSVMRAHGRPTVRGYSGAGQVGANMEERIWALIQEADEQVRLGPDNQRPPIIYFNIGWMNEYKGPLPNDPTLGNHGYLQDHDHGDECFNFLPHNGQVFGHRPRHENQVRLQRLGAKAVDETLDGVLVIWMAREPISKKTIVVGWYANARLHRHAQQSPYQIDDRAIFYTAETLAQNAKLLPLVARTFQIPSSRTSSGGFGQSPTWYGTDEVNDRVWAYIRSVGGARPRQPQRPARRARNHPSRNNNPEHRRAVEQAAINHAVAFYQSEEGGQCEVVSVEALSRGWDLEANDGRETLLIEVKGLSGSSLVCELTPNEYEKMTSDKHRERYVVYAVCNALTAPIASIFQYRNGNWQTADGRILSIEPKTGAVLRA